MLDTLEYIPTVTKNIPALQNTFTLTSHMYMIMLYLRIECVSPSSIGSVDGVVITAAVPSVVYSKHIDNYIHYSILNPVVFDPQNRVLIFIIKFINIFTSYIYLVKCCIIY